MGAGPVGLADEAGCVDPGLTENDTEPRTEICHFNSQVYHVTQKDKGIQVSVYQLLRCDLILGLPLVPEAGQGEGQVRTDPGPRLAKVSM